MKKSYFFCVILLFFQFNNLYATHSMGKDLEYVCLGPNALGQMQYRVTIRYYRNCETPTGGSAAPAPTTVSLQIFAPSCPGIVNQTINLPMNTAVNCPPGSQNGCEVSQLCASQLPNSGCNFSGTGVAPYPGVQVYVYSTIITLPVNCGAVYLGTTDCCRNDAIDNIPNPGGTDLSIQAMINNTVDPSTGQNYCNNSVTFANLPVPFVCVGSQVEFNHGAIDIDGDSLVYTLVNPLQGGTLLYTPINFNANWSVNQPVRTSPPNTFGFNTQTGQMSFVPAFQEQDALAVRVDEYRNGVLIGSTMRDIQVVVMTCTVSIPDQEPITNVQNGNQVDSITVQICPGTAMQYDILCTDPANLNLTVTSTLNNNPPAIPGAIMTPIGTGDSVIARINWTPLASDTGCHNFLLNVQNDDCPIKGSYTKVYTICVYTEVNVLSASTTYCGTPVQLSATGGSNFSWSPVTGLSNSNSLTPTASPSSDTWYFFTSDCGTDSIFLNVDPPFTLDAGPGGSICQNGQLSLNGTTDNLYAPYQIQWVPSTGLIDPILGLPNDSILNPIASPNNTTTYQMIVTGSNGCIRNDSVTVQVNGTGPIVIARANPDSVCPGEQVQLDILSQPTSCGASVQPCNGNTVNGQVGTLNQVATYSATQYPSIYGNYEKSARHQFLYKASELLAIYGAGGKISSLAFNIPTIQANMIDTLKLFTIKLACTSIDSLTGWQGGLTQVFNPKNVIPVAGWNTHNFDIIYDWDGVSNLVVDVCFFNQTDDATLNLNSKYQYSATPYRSVYYANTNNSSGACGFTGSPAPTSSKSYMRPNTRFDICISNVCGMNIQWTPAAGANAPDNPTICNPIATPQTPVIYNVDVTDPNNGCVSHDFKYVYVDTSLQFFAFPNDTFFCSPTSVTLTTQTIGTPAPGSSFSYNWIAIPGGQTYTGSSITVTPTVTTRYAVTLNGGICPLHDTVEVITGATLPVSLTLDSISCFNANDGGLTANVLGGTAPLNFSWSMGGPNTNSRTNLIPGTYSVTVTDFEGCSGSATININQPALLNLNLNPTQVNCFGGNNGSISAITIGGTTPYNYSWNPNNWSTANITSLTAGNYSLTVTDNSGCSVSASSTINQPTILTSQIVSYNASSFGGNDGWAYVLPSGGAGGYTFNWSAPGGTNDTLLNLTAGTYIVTVCDLNNCCIQDTAVITDPPPILLTFSTKNDSCFGQSIGMATVSASGGINPYTFMWSTSSTNDSIFNLTAGLYTVTVTDSAGISVIGNIQITQPPQLTVLLDTTPISCNGLSDASVYTIPSGGTPGYTYFWSPSGSSDSGLISLGPGVVNVTVTDSWGCIGTNSWNIINPPQLSVSVSNIIAVSCFNGNNGAAQANASGGYPTYSYQWSGTSQTTANVNNLQAGNNSVTVSDSRNCTATANFTVTQPAALSVAINTTNAHCETSNDGIATATVNGGVGPYSYNWNGNLGTITNSTLDNGNHTLIVSDFNNCTISQNFSIDTQYVLYTTISSTPTSCFGGNEGTATVTVLNGNPTYNYLWNAGAATTSSVSSLNAGNYSVTVRDFYNCESVNTVTVNEPSPIVTQMEHLNPLCNGDYNGRVWVIASGGTPGYTYVWNTSPVSINDTVYNVNAAVYEVTVTDNNGCSATGSEIVSDPAALTVQIQNQTPISCSNALDGEVEMAATGGTTPYSWLWNNGSTSPLLQNLGPSTYTLTVTDFNLCTASHTITFTAPPPIYFVSASTDSISCPGFEDGSISAVAGGGTPGSVYPYEYSLDNQNWQNSTVFQNLGTGTYTLFIRDSEGCMFDTTLTVGTPPLLNLSILPQDSSIQLGNSITLFSSLNGYDPSLINSFMWTPGNGLSCVDCQNPVAVPYVERTYNLVVTYRDVCVQTATVTVFVGDGPDFYIPNIFSPNGDGLNDVFQVLGFGLKTVDMKIFNRWGEKVFDSKNQWLGWDGTYKGILQPPAVYSYYIAATYLNGKTKEEKGTITLSR